MSPTLAGVGWLVYPARETSRASTYPIKGRFTLWDSSMNQMHRFAQGFARHPLPVLEDQRDRFRGLLRCFRSDRNLFTLQLVTNDYLLKRDDPAACRARVRAEIENTKAWIDALTTSRTWFFRIAEREEPLFVYRTPVEDFRLKLAVMPRHLDDEPGPFLQDLIEPKRRKLAFGAVA